MYVLLGTYISFCPIFRSLLSEFVALYLPKMHDEPRKQIIICNDDFKFATYPHSNLQEFALKNVG